MSLRGAAEATFPASQLLHSARNDGPSWLLMLMVLCLTVGCTERRQLSFLHDAEERISAGRYLEGAEILRRAVALNPKSRVAIKAVYRLGFTLESYLRDPDGALVQYQEFLRLSRDPVSVYEVEKRIANIYFEQQQDGTNAIAAYRKLIFESPDSLERDLFQLRIAEAYFRQNAFETSRAEFQLLLDQYPKSQYAARARFEIGNSYYMEGKYDIAIDALKQVIRHSAQSDYAIEAQFLIGESLEHQDKLQAALQAYEAIQGRYPASEVLDLQISTIRKRLKAH